MTTQNIVKSDKSDEKVVADAHKQADQEQLHREAEAIRGNQSRAAVSEANFGKAPVETPAQAKAREDRQYAADNAPKVLAARNRRISNDEAIELAQKRLTHAQSDLDEARRKAAKDDEKDASILSAERAKNEHRYPFATVKNGGYKYHLGDESVMLDAVVENGRVRFGSAAHTVPLAAISRNGVFIGG